MDVAVHPADGNLFVTVRGILCAQGIAVLIEEFLILERRGVIYRVHCNCFYRVNLYNYYDIRYSAEYFCILVRFGDMNRTIIMQT